MGSRLFLGVYLAKLLDNGNGVCFTSGGGGNPFGDGSPVVSRERKNLVVFFSMGKKEIGRAFAHQEIPLLSPFVLFLLVCWSPSLGVRRSAEFLYV